MTLINCIFHAHWALYTTKSNLNRLH